jgi:phage terminase large subunit-like protein
MAQDDLYDDLKKSKKWKVFEYPAIFPDGRVLWPERWNLAGLLEKKDTQGSAVFTREILVRPISSESSIFPYEITKTAYVGMEHFTLADNIYTFNTRVKMKKVVIGCDFAISANVGADYTVFTVMGIDEWGNYWLIYQWREKGAGYNEMISKMKWMNSNFRPDYFYAESNGFQKVIIDLAREKGVHNIIEHTTTINKWDIKTGLPGLAVVFENGRMKFPRGDERSKAVSDNILAELNGFTWDIELKMQSVASHDDAAMSCWLAVKGLSLTSSNMEIGYL